MAPPPRQLDKLEEKILYDLIYKQSNFFGRDKIYKKLQEQGTPISRRKVADYLAKQEINQIFRQRKKKKEIKSTIATNIFNIIGFDLVDMTTYQYTNRGKTYKWLANAVDLYSKYAFSVPMQNKEQSTVNKAINIIIKEIEKLGYKPKVIRCDNDATFGKQFRNAIDNDIKIVYSSPAKPQSSGAIEKTNGTIKRQLIKYMTYNDTYNWVDVLPDILDNYNNSYHRVIKDTPNNVIKNKLDVKKNIVEQAHKLNSGVHKSYNLNVGDFVRIQNDKEDRNSYTVKTYIVNKVFKSKKPYLNDEYQLKDSENNEILKKKYNATELLKIDSDVQNKKAVVRYEISSISAPFFGTDEKIYYMVKFKGYDEKEELSRDVLIKDAPKLLNRYEKDHPIDKLLEKYGVKSTIQNRRSKK